MNAKIQPWDLLQLNGFADDLFLEAVSYPYEHFNNNDGELTKMVFARTRIGDPNSAIYVDLNKNPVRKIYREVSE